MGTWKKEIDLIDLFEAYEEEEDPTVFAIGVSGRLGEFIQKNQRFLESEGIRDNLEELAEQFLYDSDASEVDGHLFDLFELADSARIWVATF